jgi:hypothetical protein
MNEGTSAYSSGFTAMWRRLPAVKGYAPPAPPPPPDADDILYRWVWQGEGDEDGVRHINPDAYDPDLIVTYRR